LGFGTRCLSSLLAVSRQHVPSMCPAGLLAFSRAGRGSCCPLPVKPGLCGYVRTCVLGFRHGGTASALVESLLPGVLRERARVGTGQDHRGLDAVRLSSSACSSDRGTGRARGGVLCNALLPVGLVQATARAGLRALGACTKRLVLSTGFDDRAGLVTAAQPGIQFAQQVLPAGQQLRPRRQPQHRARRLQRSGPDTGLLRPGPAAKLSRTAPVARLSVDQDPRRTAALHGRRSEG
jgi:hypothetical protein